VKRRRVATVSELDCRIVRQGRGNDNAHPTAVSVVRGGNDNRQSVERGAIRVCSHTHYRSR